MMSFLILFFLLMGVMMLSQPFFGSKLICLKWSIFSWKIMLNLWFINLKEGLRHGEIDFKCAYVPRQATYKNVEPDEKTFTSP